MTRVAPARSPALAVVAPFFLAAPFGLLTAGSILTRASSDTFLAINLPRTVAVVHAIVIGWLTTTIMGATYQLLPAVFGGRLVSQRLAQVQLGIHIAGWALFVWALLGWRTGWMGAGGIALAASFLLFLINTAPGVLRGGHWTPTRAYIASAMIMLIATMSLGLAFVGAIERLWFPITPARLSAHAHLGLAGWIGLMIIGTSYQLVPMFNVAAKVPPRSGWISLFLSVLGTFSFVLLMFSDPAPLGRLVAAVALAGGPIAGAVHLLHSMRGRAKRRMDVQGRATYLSLSWLAVAITLGFVASVGGILTPANESARWLLAYGAAAVLGWAGSTLVGNSFKILPFLIWYHRYRPQVGQIKVPVVADIYSERAASTVLGLLTATTAIAVLSALVRSTALLHGAGGLMIVASLLDLAALVHMFAPKQSSRGSITTGGPVTER